MTKKSQYFIFIITAILVILSIIIIKSPYKKYDSNQYLSIDCHVVVNCKAQQAFEYLGNSKNASNWSAFVDHITPINEDEFYDGSLHSKRKCFKQADEQGITWKEEIVEVIPNELRRLTIYNLKEFILQADGLETTQKYKSLKKDQTKITFSLYFGSAKISFMDKFKMILVSYKIERIFDSNLNNIKALLEKSC